MVNVRGYIELAWWRFDGVSHEEAEFIDKAIPPSGRIAT